MNKIEFKTDKINDVTILSDDIADQSEIFKILSNAVWLSCLRFECSRITYDSCVMKFKILDGLCDQDLNSLIRDLNFDNNGNIKILISH